MAASWRSRSWRVAIAYSYGPGVDPAWELSCRIVVIDRIAHLSGRLASR